jgi:hypothetical protein
VVHFALSSEVREAFCWPAEWRFSWIASSPRRAGLLLLVNTRIQKRVVIASPGCRARQSNLNFPVASRRLPARRRLRRFASRDDRRFIARST